MPTRPAEQTVSVPADLDPARIPRHIAVIMDGNGRWANDRDLPRVAGHKAGAESVRRTLRACVATRVEYLTLYSFSTENWKRPPEEVEALMGLLTQMIAAEKDELIERNIRLLAIGRLSRLPDDVRAALEQAIAQTAHCTGTSLCLALNYGSRAEITDAVRTIADGVAAGTLAPADINEDAISSRLYTAGLPDPDLLIRTAGEKRLSNFLLWQISYAELHITDTRWPDFAEDDLYAAIRDYQSRDRRFGNTKSKA